MSGLVGFGDFVPWVGGCLLIGRAVSITPMHSHYAIQVALGSEPGIRFRTSDDEEWVPYPGVVIPSRQPHTMDATCVTFDAVLFVEPETPEGRALTQRFGGRGISGVEDSSFLDAGAALFDLWQVDRSTEALVGAARKLVGVLSDEAGIPSPSDERIVRAVSFINSRLDGPITLEDVANEIHLSPSRFRHLFVEQTGTAFQPYVLWRRFLLAWEVVMRGGSLSSAAHSAGFADAAHLSRTSNRMFGFPPSALQINARQ